jgi:predicted PurR-regulated permease PerM
MIPQEIRNNTWVKFGIFVVGVLFTGFLAWWASNIIAPFIVAFFLAYILDPAVYWMEQNIGLRRMTSIIIILVLFTLLVSVLGYYLVEEAITFGNQVQEILRDPPDIKAKIEAYSPQFLKSYFKTVTRDFERYRVYERFQNIIWNNLMDMATDLSGGTDLLAAFVSRTMGILNFLINMVVVIFSTIYILRDFDAFVSGVRNEIPAQYRNRTDEIFSEINLLFRSFLRGHLIICIAVGILYGTGYLLVGLEGGFLIGFLSGLMNFIPYVGSSIGFLLAFIMAMAQFGISVWVLSVALVFVVVQSFEGNILRPNILGSAVGLNPVFVIFSLMFFGKLMGFIGLLLAVPITAVLKVLFNHALDSYHKSKFYQGRTEG